MGKKDKKDKKKGKKNGKEVPTPKKKTDKYAGMTAEEKQQAIRDAKSHKAQKLNLWDPALLPPLVIQWKAQEAGTWKGPRESIRKMSKRTGIPRYTLA